MVPNTNSPGKDFRNYQVKVREIEKCTGLDFNSALPSAEAAKLEVVTGGDWIMPGARSKNKDASKN
jgi:DNA/RNA endonuclease G (NUC1)